MIKTIEIVTVFRVRGDGLWPAPDAERLYHQLAIENYAELTKSNLNINIFINIMPTVIHMTNANNIYGIASANLAAG